MKTSLIKFVLVFAAIAIIATGCGAPANENKNAIATNNSNALPTNASPSTTSANVGPGTACDDDRITESLKKTYANPPFAADAGNFNFFSKGCKSRYTAAFVTQAFVNRRSLMLKIPRA